MTDLILEIDAHDKERPKPSKYLLDMYEKHTEERVRRAQNSAADIVEAVRKDDFREGGILNIQAGHVSLNQDILIKKIAEALLYYGAFPLAEARKAS